MTEPKLSFARLVGQDSSSLRGTLLSILQELGLGEQPFEGAQRI
jgi:hypothetical protein